VVVCIAVASKAVPRIAAATLAAVAECSAAVVTKVGEVAEATAEEVRRQVAQSRLSTLWGETQM
jgi:hypothetical protein